MLGVALARSASGQRWPEPGEAVNLIVSGIGERLAGMLRRPDQRDTAAVAILAGWPAAEVAAVTYTPLTANSGTISDPLSGLEGWLTDSAATPPSRRAISPGKPSFQLGASARVRPCWARIV